MAKDDIRDTAKAGIRDMIASWDDANLKVSQALSEREQLQASICHYLIDQKAVECLQVNWTQMRRIARLDRSR